MLIQCWCFRSIPYAQRHSRCFFEAFLMLPRSNLDASQKLFRCIPLFWIKMIIHLLEVLATFVILGKCCLPIATISYFPSFVSIPSSTSKFFNFIDTSYLVPHMFPLKWHLKGAWSARAFNSRSSPHVTSDHQFPSHSLEERAHNTTSPNVTAVWASLVGRNQLYSGIVSSRWRHLIDQRSVRLLVHGLKRATTGHRNFTAFITIASFLWSH